MYKATGANGRGGHVARWLLACVLLLAGADDDSSAADAGDERSGGHSGSGGTGGSEDPGDAGGGAGGDGDADGCDNGPGQLFPPAAPFNQPIADAALADDSDAIIAYLQE